MAQIVTFKNELDAFAGLAFTTWKRYFWHAYETIVKADLQDDWRQEAYTIATSAYVKYKNLPHDKTVFKKMLSEMQSEWYYFLKNYGYRKPKHSRFFVPQFDFSKINFSKINIEGIEK